MNEIVDEARRLKRHLVERMFGPPPEVAPPRRAGLATALPSRAGVVGVGFGVKLVGGLPTGGWAVRVYVRTKRPRGQLTMSELIPDTIEGRPTDVIGIGDIWALQRPVNPGVSIGHVDISAGTLGAVVEVDDVTVLEANLEHGIRQCISDFAVVKYRYLFSHESDFPQIGLQR
jgi:hypothetical protein